MTESVGPRREFDPAACAADGVVFVDESRYRASRFGAVASATIRRTAIQSFAGHWATARRQGDELKWAGVTNSHASRAALDCLNVVRHYVLAGHLRIDVLTWDRNDSRFRDVRRPDDLANLVRMFQHLIVNALDKWDDLLAWDYVPDEHAGIPWDKTWRPLDFGLTKKRREIGGPYQTISRPYPSNSAMHPLIQVADIFAGYGAYVAEQPSRADNPATSSNMERQRAPVVMAMTALVREVSYARFNGITTPKDTLINFWPYRSQGDFDRVPVSLPRHLANVDAESLSNHRCVHDGCVEFVTFGQSIFRAPLCLEHFRESAAERDAVEKGKARHETFTAGRFWCEACDFKRYTEETATRHYDAHADAYVYYCPQHQTRLEILIEDEQNSVLNQEIDKRTRYADKSYPG